MKAQINPVFRAQYEHNPHRGVVAKKLFTNERKFLLEVLASTPAIRLHDVGKALGVYL